MPPSQAVIQNTLTGPNPLRAAFHGAGVALTAYSGGYVRLSMPDRPWRTDELDRLAAVFRAIA